MVIDILCVVDGKSLLRDYPNTSEKNPATLSHSGGFPIWLYCRMITRYMDALHKNAHDDLTIYAEVGNTVRWRATSLTLEKEFRVEITDYKDFDHGVCPQPKQVGKDDLWETKIAKAGDATYWLHFKVIPGASGAKPGFFWWDPGIKAVESGAKHKAPGPTHQTPTRTPTPSNQNRDGVRTVKPTHFVGEEREEEEGAH